MAITAKEFKQGKYYWWRIPLRTIARKILKWSGI
jgi:hypothetical protein